MNPKNGAGFLIAAYLVFGTGLVSMQASYSVLPKFQNVYYRECHTGCKPGTGTSARNPCVVAKICRTEQTYPKKGSTLSHGSTGPTVPPKPVTHY